MQSFLEHLTQACLEFCEVFGPKSFETQQAGDQSRTLRSEHSASAAPAPRLAMAVFVALLLVHLTLAVADPNGNLHSSPGNLTNSTTLISQGKLNIRDEIGKLTTLTTVDLSDK